MTKVFRIGEIMNKDNLWWLLLIVAAVLMISNAVSAGEWNEKPVMCEQKEIVQKLLRDKGEVLLMSGIQLTKVRDPDEPNGYSPIPATLPLQVFVNLETKTFSITELHPTYNSICIIAYGENFSSLLLDTM